MHVVFNLHYQMFVIHMENKQQQQLLRMNLLLNVKNELQQIKELQEIMIKWKIIYRCLYLFSIMFSGNKLIKIKFFYFLKSRICMSLLFVVHYILKTGYIAFSHDMTCPSTLTTKKRIFIVVVVVVLVICYDQKAVISQSIF